MNVRIDPQDQEICGVRLGANGMEPITKTSALAQFRDEMTKAAISPLVQRDEAEIRKSRDAQRAARQRLHEARFFAYRDASHQSDDIAKDPDVRRRSRRLSITRDMIDGPGRVRSSYDLSTGRMHGPRASGTGGDRYRFMHEADALRIYGVVDEKALPDWKSDESILRFFGDVYDKALQEARDGQPDTNRVIDAAPGIFLFTELLKRSEKLVEEDFTQMWARRVFPILNLNTWLPQWYYERIDDRAMFPQYVDVEYLPSNAPRGSENRDAEIRKLAFWHHAASWSNLELMRFAEAVANGAPNIQLDTRRINAAIRMMNWFENNLAFFGDPAADIQGLFSPAAETGIERIASGGLFGAGTTEADRQLLTREVKLILENTEQILRPNTIMLSTRTWLYVNDQRYGDVSADTNQTVLEAAKSTLSKFGITDILWVPEVGYSTAQENRLLQHGVPAAEAQRLAGGIGDGNQSMVVLRRDPDVCEMVVAKDRMTYPARETVNDRVEARMLQGGGGCVFYKPEGIKIVTNVGPA